MWSEVIAHWIEKTISPRTRSILCDGVRGRKGDFRGSLGCNSSVRPLYNLAVLTECEGDFPSQILGVGWSTNTDALPGRSRANTMKLVDFSMTLPYNSFVRNQVLLSSSLSLSYLSLQMGGGV